MLSLPVRPIRIDRLDDLALKVEVDKWFDAPFNIVPWYTTRTMCYSNHSIPVAYARHVMIHIVDTRCLSYWRGLLEAGLGTPLLR